MNEQDFENLLALAKSNNLDSVRLAREIAENSDLPRQDKKTIICECLISEMRLAQSLNEIEYISKTLYPFKKQQPCKHQS